jgi:hypothetical protein
VACGPDVEAWFLGMVGTCGLLVVDSDINRLSDLEAELLEIR